MIGNGQVWIHGMEKQFYFIGGRFQDATPLFFLNARFFRNLSKKIGKKVIKTTSGKMLNALIYQNEPRIRSDKKVIKTLYKSCKNAFLDIKTITHENGFF